MSTQPCPLGCEARLEATYEALGDHLIDEHGIPEEEVRRAQMSASIHWVFGVGPTEMFASPLSRTPAPETEKP